jgi:predicted NUDIX family phosphoesterase
MKEENVLVVPSAGIKPFLSGKFTPGSNDAALQFIRSNFSFRPRSSVEEDPSFKQIIPYTLLQCGERTLLSWRSKKQGEKRLHGKASLGIGGHINDQDQPKPGQDILMAALERELEEELEVKAPRKALSLLGLISDDSNPVGQVHLGLAYLLELASPDAVVRETDMMESRWVANSELAGRQQEMETWSQIVFEHLAKSLQVKK